MKQFLLSCGYIVTMLLFTMIFSFTGCVSSEVKKNHEVIASSQKQATALTPPESILVSKPNPSQPALLGQVRLDLSAVLQGLFYKLQGRKGDTPGYIAFDPQIKDIEKDIDIDLSLFALKAISIRKDESVKNNPLHRRTKAVFKVRDSLGRQLFLIVAADYLIGDNVIFIRQAAALPYYPDYVDIRFMVLPASRLPSLKFLTNLPFEDLFSLAAENALSRQELLAIKPGSKNSFKLMAFNMARIKPDSTINIFTSNTAIARSIMVKKSLTIKKQGWAVAMVEGQFELNTPPGFWFSIGMTDTSGSTRTKLLSRFNSNLAK